MKNYLKITAMMLVASMLIAGVANGQKKSQIPENGSWQLVSNKASKKNVTIQFYTNDGKLIYEEKLVNVKLNINRPRVVRKLNKALNEVMVAFNEARSINSNEKLVARTLAGD